MGILTLESQRDHDRFYLDENRKLTPKEYFKFIVEEVRKDGARPSDILDIGCATGDFAWYLKESFPEANVHGVDVMPDLVVRARAEVPKATFSVADITKPESLPAATYDMIFMAGVHSIFDDVATFIDPIARALKPGGRAYVFGMWNPLPYDVIMRVRPAHATGPWQSGWNVFSHATARRYAEKLGGTASFVPWRIQIPMEPKADDGLRSWTMRLADGSFEVINATQIVHRFALMKWTR